MNDKTINTTSGGGISFLGLLTIVFITLKLTHYIDWSWAWVLSPIWIPFTILIGIGSALLITVCYFWIINDK